jgi:hypothetical protein
MIASISLVGLGLLLLPFGHFRALQEARQRLELFEYESWKKAGREAPRRRVAVFEAAPTSLDSRGRREYRVVDQEPRGLSALMETPRTGQIRDLSTGNLIDEWYVAEIRSGEIWESTQGRAVQLSGGVLYNLMSQRISVVLSVAFAAFGFALVAWRRVDDRGKVSTPKEQSSSSSGRIQSDANLAQQLTSSDPQYVKCSRCGFEQWASYSKCQQCGARFVAP